MRDLPDLSAARARIAGRVHNTPLLRAGLLGKMVGTELFLKCENLQKTGSFKARGVLNKLTQLPENQKNRGVVTVSAGNHAQALAWGANQEQMHCIVVMNAAASPTKAEASRDYGAEVVLHGTIFDAFEKAHEIERERGLTFIHPFDDPDIVAGHASAGLEILETLPDADVVVVPIGGGGLISGIAAAIKQQRPSTRVYGVEPTGAAAMIASLEQGHAVHLEKVNTVADGLAAPMAGNLNYEIVKEYVDDVVMVSDEEILHAMTPIYSRTKLVVEPAGAAGVAALLTQRIPVKHNERVVAVLSGGNVELEKLGQFLSRAR